jgi:hypothetical protein
MMQESVLQDIKPTILQLRSGAEVWARIEKLVHANNPERAIKLLRVAPRTRRSTNRILSGIGVVILVGLVLFGAPVMNHLDGGYEPAMEAINACPRATEALGAPIVQSFVGMSCGGSKTSSSFGRANWRISVKGSKASGRYQYVARNNGSGWRVLSAELSVGDSSIGVVPCPNKPSR